MFNIFSNRFKRRYDFYSKCQEAIDYIHKSINEGTLIDETRCSLKFGNDVYSAIVHQLRDMNAYDDSKVMTAAMNWLYFTQYFIYKMNEEKLQTKYYVISLVASVLSFIIAAISLCMSLMH